jgi:ribonuclease J
MSDSTLRVIPLGGLGEFGMNCMALELDNDIIVVDAGMMFPDAELLGVDFVTPDFSYLTERKEKVRALIVTHGHEDHLGAVPFFLDEINVPVYATPFTLALVERRLDDRGPRIENPKLKPVQPGQSVKLGQFEVEFIQVTHSICEAAALAIKTPLGTVIHTGDFKIDLTPTDNKPFDLHAFAEHGRKGVLLLMADSTNVDRPGWTESERAVRPRLESLFRETAGRLVISCFSSSVHRIQQIIDLCQQYGRKITFLGRSMNEVSEIAHDLGLLHIPDGIVLRPQDVDTFAPKQVCVVVSGTQGEPMSALSRIAVDDHKHLSLRASDTVVMSARMIPGNEKQIYRMINHIAKRGANVVYGPMNPPVHVSGHASEQELKLILNLCQPKFFMPVHGEYRQLFKHANLAEPMRAHGLQDSFVMETGEILEINKKGAKRAGKAQAGRVCIDSGTVEDRVDDHVIKDRRHLSVDGFLVPIVAINKLTGEVERVELVSRGFVSESADLLDAARSVLGRTLDEASNEERSNGSLIQEKIRADLKRFINKATQRRPLITPVILEV